MRSFFYIIVLGLEKSNDFMVEWYGKRKLCYCSHHNVGKLSVSERYARETGREAVGNGLLLFPVSRLRIPKISEFRFMGFSQTEVIQKSPFRVS